MNIFFLDHDPVTCAQLHCDKHVVKMILEYAQLLSTAHHMIDGEQVPTGIYKCTHKNHPSAIWARENRSQYSWLYELFVALCNEYTHRYGKVHKTDEKLRHVLKSPPRYLEPGLLFDPPQCMPDAFKREDTIEAYVAYYLGGKDQSWISKYTKRPQPEWMTTP